MLRSTTTLPLSRHLRHHHLRIHPLRLLPQASSQFNGPYNRQLDHNGRRTIATSTAATTTAAATSSTLDTVLDTTQSLILTLQATTSLPWILTIPLVAILVRTTITLPFSLYSYKRTNTQLSLMPLVRGWTNVFRKQVARERWPNTPDTPKELRGAKVFAAPQAWQKEVLVRTKKKREEIFKEFGCQYWKSFVGLVQLPVWFLASMSVRKLIGVPGFWGSKRESELDMPVSGAEGQVADVASAGDMLAIDAAEGGLAAVSSTAEQGSGKIDEVTAAVREQMQHGGIEGWFPDLLQPDPYMVLPILFSLTVFTNISWSMLSATAEAVGWRKALNNALMMMSIAIIPLTINSPAVLHLYWIASSSYSLVQNIVLRQMYPRPRPVKPVQPKLPVWMKGNEEAESGSK
ncbi:hypothetical protein H072_3729 [Dactylellina haptotyla CBS 200.50]|uniref:Uncharacterized protein n=1 Tax=Dactylellina haptotyla (strain CBS 200.50) TaxID=1284197 RepID=S8C3M2_DACHA|nr:hypothetical protein H072_3729 [Dactylellina haptotyla CBS 200.50]